MTELEKTQYKILSFLNSSRRDINITDEILKQQFYDIDKDLYVLARLGLALGGKMGKTSANNQWQITEIGEIELNRLQTKIDAIKRDPIATEIQNDLEELQKTHLKQQIKQGNRRYLESIISFVAGAILAGGLLLLQTKLQNSKEVKEIPIKVSIATHPPIKDTIYINSGNHTKSNKIVTSSKK